MSIDTEEIAVSSIKKLLSRSAFLDAKWIASGDRGPSLDGEILVYKTGGRQKKNLDGSVPVQVKSVRYKQSEFPEKVVSFDVEISDIKNILHRGGALFFVVYINDDSEKIYYRRLAPFDINELLKTVKESQKTKRIDLKPFPDDINEISSELISFLHDCRKQTIVTDGVNRTVSEIKEGMAQNSIEYKISFTGVGYEDKSPIEYLLNHDAYIYAENKKLNIAFPIDRIPQSDSVEETRNISTGVGNRIFFQHATCRYSKHKEETILGSCIKFILDKTAKTIKLSFKAQGNLYKRLQGEEFLYELFTQKDLVVGGQHIPFAFEEEEIKQAFNLDRLRNEVSYLKEVRDTLEYYGTDASLELDGMSEQDFETLKALTQARKNGSVRLKEKHVEGLQRIRINNLHVILYLSMMENNTYRIDSFFDVVLPTNATIADQIIPTSQFAILTVEDFLLLSNLNYSKIEGAVSLFNDENHLEQMRLLMLRMLCAYDLNGSTVQLECASKLAKKIKKNNTCRNCVRVSLNQPL